MTPYIAWDTAYWPCETHDAHRTAKRQTAYASAELINFHSTSGCYARHARPPGCQVTRSCQDYAHVMLNQVLRRRAWSCMVEFCCSRRASAFPQEAGGGVSLLQFCAVRTRSKSAQSFHLPYASAYAFHATAHMIVSLSACAVSSFVLIDAMRRHLTDDQVHGHPVE